MADIPNPYYITEGGTGTGDDSGDSFANAVDLIDGFDYLNTTADTVPTGGLGVYLCGNFTLPAPETTGTVATGASKPTHAGGTTTIQATAGVFGASDVGRSFRFDTSGNSYVITAFTNVTTIDIDDSKGAAGYALESGDGNGVETASDTFKIGAGLHIQREAAADSYKKPIVIQGRDGTDGSTATVVTLDANNQAFSVVNLDAPFLVVKDVKAYNTDGLEANNGFNIGFRQGAGTAANEDEPAHLIRCEAEGVWAGFEVNNNTNGSAAYAPHAQLYACTSESNQRGFSSDLGYMGLCVDCIARDNTESGFYQIKTVAGCLSHDNTSDGYRSCVLHYACTADGNGRNGFDPVASEGSIDGGGLYHCLSTNNTNNAVGEVKGTNTKRMLLVNFAHYNNNAVYTTAARFDEINTIALTADPYSDATNDDYRINNITGGGALLRMIESPVGDATYNTYVDIGSYQNDKTFKPSLIRGARITSTA